MDGPSSSAPHCLQLAYGPDSHRNCTTQSILSMMALVNSEVLALPPRSPVRYLPSAITPSTASYRSSLAHGAMTTEVHEAHECMVIWFQRHRQQC
jgi:hypothetical protein